MVDIACNSSGSSSTDVECLVDQTAWYAYNQYDARSNLSGKQNVTIHVIGIDTDSDTLNRCSISKCFRYAGWFRNIQLNKRLF